MGATTVSISKTTLEKLKPATSIAGLAAEVAEVTRFYNQDFDTGETEEYGIPIITVLWGKTVEDKLAELEQQKVAIADQATEAAAALDELKGGLEKAAVKG